MRGQNLGKAEALRGLGAPQAGAVHRAGHQPAIQPAFAALQRVGDRHGGERRRMVVQRRDHRVDGGRVDQRARRVVDQHPVRRRVGQRLQPVAHRILTGGAASHRFGQVQPRDRRVVEIAEGGIDDDAHRAHLGVAQESLHRAAQHGLAGQIEILLGPLGAEPLAASGGDDQRDTGRHGTFPCRLGYGIRA